MSIYRPIITGADVQAAAMDTLQLWMPAYVAELERQTGREPRSVPLPKTWKHTTEKLQRWPEDQVPAVIVVSPGTEGDPLVNGDGTYDVAFVLGVGVIVAARDQPSANDLVKLYAAAIRTLLVQHASLGGFASGLVWSDEKYDGLPADYLSVGAGAELTFFVAVSGVMSEDGGPGDPPDDPYDDPGEWPTVETTELILTAEEIA